VRIRGTLLNVLEFIGSWAKVELASARVTGFVRREFLIAINNADSDVTHNSLSGEEIADATVLAFGSTR